MSYFGSRNVKTFTVLVSDPGADNKQITLLRAPQHLTITKMWLTTQNAQGAGSAGAFEIQNWGTAGTAVVGTVFSSLGGTGTAVRLSAGVSAAGVAVDNTIAPNEIVRLDYQETGDWVEGIVTIEFHIVDGLAV